MIMARSVILPLAVLHFGSALVTGDAEVAWAKDADFQVVEGRNACGADLNVADLAGCNKAFGNFARARGLAVKEAAEETGTDPKQCRAKVGNGEVEVFYRDGAAAEGDTHTACRICATANERMVVPTSDAYECKAPAESWAVTGGGNNAGKPLCPIGKFYDGALTAKCTEEATMICADGFIPYVEEDMSTKQCIYVGDNTACVDCKGREEPLGYLLPKSAKVQAAANLESKHCYETLLVAGPAMDDWRSVATKDLEFAAAAAATCVAEVGDNKYKGKMEATPTADQYSFMKRCDANKCPRNSDAAEWKCDDCATGAAVDSTNNKPFCPPGKVAVWGENESDPKPCWPAAVPVCDIGYRLRFEGGKARCYKDAGRQPDSCPDLHTPTLTNQRWSCTVESGARCFQPDETTCPNLHEFNADSKCVPKAGKNVIVAEKENIKCYLEKDLVPEDAGYKCGAVDVKCPKGYKQNVADNKIECKAEGTEGGDDSKSKSGSIHATASFAAMISVVGAVLMRM